MRSGWLMATPPTVGLAAERGGGSDRAAELAGRAAAGAGRRAGACRVVPALGRAAGVLAAAARVRRVILELAHDLGGRLVLPQSLEHRVPQLAVAGPLAEGHLGDQGGRGPVHAARLSALGRVGERRRAPLERAEALRQPRQRGVAEPAADAAGVAQGALPVVDAEQEGAEPVARARTVR